MSLFNMLGKRRLIKRRDELCEEAKIFIQVHYVREKEYRSLSLKSDSEREECVSWYESHGNPSTFSDIVACYISDRKIDAAKLANAYHLDSKFIQRVANEPDFMVSKSEAILICLGLKLNITEARVLLDFAGYTLTYSSHTDLVVRYCIENGYTSYGDVNYILSNVCQTRLKDIA